MPTTSEMIWFEADHPSWSGTKKDLLIEQVVHITPSSATEEREPGVWTMVTPDGREYGLVEIRRLDGRIVYRVTAMGQPAGYAGTLREACARIHHVFIASHSPGPPPGGIYPDLFGGLRSAVRSDGVEP